MKWDFGWKRTALSVITAASIGLSVGLPVRAAEHEDNERVEQIWREIRDLAQLKDTLRNYGHPDPYGWFRSPSARRVRYALADEREGEIYGQTLPLDLEKMFAPPGISPNDPSLTKPKPWTGEAGITETVAQIMARENSGPPPRRHDEVEHEYPPVPADFPRDPLSPPVSQWPPPCSHFPRRPCWMGSLQHRYRHRHKMRQRWVLAKARNRQTRRAGNLICS